MPADTFDFVGPAATPGGAPSHTFSLPLAKLDGTVAPGAGNDDSQGYAHGSPWVDTVARLVYFCADNATGAAVWLVCGAGATGPTGPAGPVGPPGLVGEPGEDGMMGPPGAAGPQGITGGVGAMGPAVFMLAEPGEDGMMGPPGRDGIAGPAGGDLIGTYPNPTVAQASQAFALTGDISDTLSGNQNDYNPTGLSTASVIRLIASGGKRNVTGLQGGADGRIVLVENVGTAGVDFALVFNHESASSTAANRFAMPGGTIVELEPGRNMTIIYDSTSSRWRVITGLVVGAVAAGDLSGTYPNPAVAADAVTYAKIQNVTATARVLGRKTVGSGDPEECTLSDVLDFIGSAAQGDILFRDAATWSRLAAGTSGQFLKTLGTGANPAWAASGPTPPAYNASVGNQGPGLASDTYLTGSNVAIPAASLKAGSRYRCIFNVAKSAAGIAAPIIQVRFGVNGTVADTSLLTFTFPAQTGVTDEGVFELVITFRAVGSGTTAVLNGFASLTHRAAITGLSVNNAPVVSAGSAGFDSTVAGSIIGASINGGTSASWTVTTCQSELCNLV